MHIRRVLFLWFFLGIVFLLFSFSLIADFVVREGLSFEGSSFSWSVFFSGLLSFFLSGSLLLFVLRVSSGELKSGVFNSSWRSFFCVSFVLLLAFLLVSFVVIFFLFLFVAGPAFSLKAVSFLFLLLFPFFASFFAWFLAFLSFYANELLV